MRKCKILIVGDAAVGKTSLKSQYVDGVFKSDVLSTIGVDFSSKQIVVNGTDAKLQIWDTAGMEQFRAITRSYYRGARIALLVFDVTQKDTFSNIETWHQDLKTNTKDCHIVLIGNKTDLTNRMVSEDEAKTLAQKLGIDYIETSAKTRANVSNAFEAIFSDLMDFMDFTDPADLSDDAKTAASGAGMFGSSAQQQQRQQDLLSRKPVKATNPCKCVVM